MHCVILLAKKTHKHKYRLLISQLTEKYLYAHSSKHMTNEKPKRIINKSEEGIAGIVKVCDVTDAFQKA